MFCMNLDLTSVEGLVKRLRRVSTRNYKTKVIDQNLQPNCFNTNSWTLNPRFYTPCTFWWNICCVKKISNSGSFGFYSWKSYQDSEEIDQILRPNRFANSLTCVFLDQILVAYED